MSKQPTQRRQSLNRRDFLKVSSGAVAGAASVPVIVTGTAVSVTSGDAAAASAMYPVLDVARLADLEPGSSVLFSYPDDASPAMLLRLSEAAESGVGDDRSVVAFSILCTHKGCPVSYKAERGLLICPCHWSTFDPAKLGSLVIGQASTSLPRIELKLNDGVVQAVGVNGLIYGRHTNIL